MNAKRWATLKDRAEYSLLEAINLSMGIDPEYQTHWGDPEFRRRIDIAIGNVKNRRLNILADAPNVLDSRVNLPVFVNWAIFMKWSIPPELSAPLPDPTKPIGVQQQTEMQVINTLLQLGFDPARLPRPRQGKPGPKKACRETFPEHRRKHVFDKAWKRLAANGKIAYADSMVHIGP